MAKICKLSWIQSFISIGLGFMTLLSVAFQVIDPISDKFPHVSPYNYAENELVGSIHLWGLQRYKVNGHDVISHATKDEKKMLKYILLCVI